MSEILERLSNVQDKGRFLEELVVELIKELSFINVSKQNSGSQYGYDIIGYTNNGARQECWKFECKNLQQAATIYDIAPKLAWHINSPLLDRFVIISPNGINNDLRHLLESNSYSFPIEIWHGEYLENLIARSPSALQKLGIESLAILPSEVNAPLVFEASKVKMNVAYFGLPFSQDYLVLNGEHKKCYTEHEFKLTAQIENRTSASIVVQSIYVKTLRHENTTKCRVLRQYTQRGLVKPTEIKFNPKTSFQGRVNLIEDFVLPIKSSCEEFIEFKLSKKCEPGYYDIVFEMVYMEGGKAHTLTSPVFSLHKLASSSDVTRLCVLSNFYDSPTAAILNLDNLTWSKIRNDYPSHIKYLGPGQNDRTTEYKIWTVNLLKVKRTKTDNGFTLEVNMTRQTELLEDLDIPVEEKVIFADDLLREAMDKLGFR